jgi:hypothetical protein
MHEDLYATDTFSSHAEVDHTGRRRAVRRRAAGAAGLAFLATSRARTAANCSGSRPAAGGEWALRSRLRGWATSRQAARRVLKAEATLTMLNSDDTTASQPRRFAAEEPAPGAREAEPDTGSARPCDRDGSGPAAHAARPLASEQAPGTERWDTEELSVLAGEEPSDSATGFYVVLGVIIASLLLVLTWLSGSSREAGETALLRHPPVPPVVRPGPGSWHGRPLAPPSRAMGGPLARGEAAPGRAGAPGGASSGSGSSPFDRAVPGAPAAPSFSRHANEAPVSTPPRAGGSRVDAPPLPAPIPPGAAPPPSRGNPGAPTGMAPGPPSPGANTLPGAAGIGTRPAVGYPGKPGNSRLLYPPAYSPPAPMLPGR